MKKDKPIHPQQKDNKKKSERKYSYVCIIAVKEYNIVPNDTSR